MKLCSTDIDDIIEKYKTGKFSCSDIGKEYNVSKCTIRYHLKKNNINIEQYKFNGNFIDFQQEKVQEMIEMYTTGKFSCMELGKHFGVSHVTIHRRLRSFNIPEFKFGHFSRKYQVNENYFQNIDTEDKAYFLGLLAADGCNFMKSNVFIIGLQENDSEILDKFQIYMNSNYKLYNIKSNIIKGKKKYYKGRPQKTLQICSEKMCIDLYKLGIVPAKSLILKFPTQEQVPHHLIRHFVRGYFDGDGTLGAGYRDYGLFRITSGLVSSKDFCTSLKEIIIQECGIDAYINQAKKDGNPLTYTLSLTYNNQSLKFLNWIYKDSTVFLKRKYDLYLYSLFCMKKLDRLSSQNLYTEKRVSKKRGYKDIDFIFSNILLQDDWRCGMFHKKEEETK